MEKLKARKSKVLHAETRQRGIKNQELGITLPWKVIYVNSRAEKKIGQKLLALGIESYVPLRKDLRQWSDRRKMVEVPMISGYVLVNPANVQERDKVLQQQGVLQYVRYNGNDAIVRDEEIAALRSIEKKGYFIEGKFGTPPGIGDDAVIRMGPFRGLRGMVKSAAGEDIYNIVIEGLGYCLTLSVPREVLSKP